MENDIDCLNIIYLDDLRCIQIVQDIAIRTSPNAQYLGTSIEQLPGQFHTQH
ncbi:hypothetical protein GCM10009108_01710 [Castellaniella ginsengisoli]|uniref:Uncharacterized protein n=1 Tax=Castellaniella ginsengisoli TaxID=546114 RepID=A0ABP3VZW4_9BURK